MTPIKNAIQWLRTPPERPNARGTTILMWALIFASFGAGVLSNNSKQDDARHEAVCTVRLALNDLYNFAEELGSLDAAEARARLDRLIPDDDCGAA